MANMEDESVANVIESATEPSNVAEPTNVAEPANIAKPAAKRGRGLSSVVWKVFERPLNEDGSESGKVICSYCKFEYAHENSNYGTSTLRNHLSRCKKNPNRIAAQSNQTTLDFGKMGDNVMLAWKYDAELARKAFSQMVILDELPFRFVEREGFRHFMSVVQPNFKILSRTTVAKDCLELYQEERRKLKHFLTSTNQRVSLTTDIWTSVQNISYMCVTIHFIDKNWNLNKRIISFAPIHSHKGSVIGGCLDNCLKDWGLKNVCTLTVDNASSNDTAIGHLKKVLQKSTFVLDGQYFHVRCSAHILNLIIKDGLNDMKVSVSRIRSDVRYIRSSPQRANQFKEFCKEEGLPCNYNLVLDVPTRWNSTYAMLDSAIQFQRAFVLMETREPTFYADLGLDIPTELDWENVVMFRKFLKAFYVATKKFSGSLFVTSNQHFHELYSIELLLKEWCLSYDPSLRTMAAKMKDKFDKYWGSIEKRNLMLLVAVVLDPRFKLEYVAHIYKKLYPLNKVDGVVDKLNGVLKDLYASYLTKVKPTPLAPEEVREKESVQDDPNLSNLASHAQDEYWKMMEERESGSKNELEKYLAEACKKGKGLEKFDILKWWKNNEFRYPVLAEIARDILAIPVSTVASESAFSTGGRVLDVFRSSLTPKIVECLICAQDWLRSPGLPIQVEERLEELEELEIALSKALENISISDDDVVNL